MVETTLALAATVLTLAAFAAAGAWHSRGVRTVEQFLTARDSTGGGRLAATLFASYVGVWVLASVPEAGARFGGISAVLGYAVGGAVPMVAYAVLGPRIRSLMPEGHSLTEYALARYGPAMYGYVLVVSVAYMTVFLAVEFTVVASALSLLAGVPGWQTAGLVGLATLAYTGYGGLRASIFTDALQTAVLVPLLVVTLAGAVLALGGPGTVLSEVAASHPGLLDPAFLPGLRFGTYVVIAVLGAEMLNQAWWQRIYAASGDRDLRRGFLAAAAGIVPLLALAGLFGVLARGLGYVGPSEASVALFALVAAAFPDWAALAVVLVALLFVASTADTMFNAVASVVTVDLPRVVDADDATLLAGARLLTGVVALGAVVVGAQGYSVLTLFFTADLLATATFGPLLAGLYSSRLTGWGALLAALAGLAVGVAFFPPAGLLPEASFLRAFGGSALVALTATGAAALVADAEFDHRELRSTGGTLAADGGRSGRSDRGGRGD